jgi:hypothetical protein
MRIYYLVTFLKMVYLTDMLSIFNSIFTIVFYAMR